jgi:hypothetical protein
MRRSLRLFLVASLLASGSQAATAQTVSAGNSDNLKILLSLQDLHADPRGSLRGQSPDIRDLERGEPVAEMGSGNVDPSHYLPLLIAGYTGLKAGDSNAIALLGAPSPTGANIPGESVDDLQYLRQLFALNGGQALAYFDAVLAHPSGFSNPPDCTPATPQCSLSGGFNNNDSFFAFTRVSQYHDLMVSSGIGAKKIWFTEFGYCSNSTPPPGYQYCTSIDATTQANFPVQAFQMARNLDFVAAMMQWNLNYQLAVPQTDEKWGFGIIRDDWSARPAYSALAQMAKP